MPDSGVSIEKRRGTTVSATFVCESAGILMHDLLLRMLDLPDLSKVEKELVDHLLTKFRVCLDPDDSLANLELDKEEAK